MVPIMQVAFSCLLEFDSAGIYKNLVYNVEVMFQETFVIDQLIYDRILSVTQRLKGPHTMGLMWCLNNKPHTYICPLIYM